MLTQDTIDKFYKDVESLKIKKKGAEITKATGFPKSNVSEYLRKIKSPSENFIIAFYEKFGKMLPNSSTEVPPVKNNTELPIPQVHEDPAVYNTVLPMGDVSVTLKDYIELWKLFYIKEEEKNKELISIIKDLAKGQNEIKEALQPIKANSETILADLKEVRDMTRADDLSMMEGTDKILGRESGETAKEAHIVEHALAAPDLNIDKNDSNDKQNSSSTRRRQRKA